MERHTLPLVTPPSTEFVSVFCSHRQQVGVIRHIPRLEKRIKRMIHVVESPSSPLLGREPLRIKMNSER